MKWIFQIILVFLYITNLILFVKLLYKDHSYKLQTVAKRITCFENDVTYFKQLQIICIIGK